MVYILFCDLFSLRLETFSLTLNIWTYFHCLNIKGLFHNLISSVVGIQVICSFPSFVVLHLNPLVYESLWAVVGSVAPAVCIGGFECGLRSYSRGCCSAPVTRLSPAFGSSQLQAWFKKEGAQSMQRVLEVSLWLGNGVNAGWWTDRSTGSGPASPTAPAGDLGGSFIFSEPQFTNLWNVCLPVLNTEFQFLKL